MVVLPKMYIFADQNQLDTVGRFSQYDLLLRNLSEGESTFEFLLNDKFFTIIDDEQVRKGKVAVVVFVKRVGNSFELKFKLEGSIQIPCDRCLDEMTLPVELNELLIVRFGTEYGEEGDNIIIIPEQDGVLNVAWFMFEFLALSIPIKHVHGPGLCNKEMASKLRKHSTRKSDEVEEYEAGEERFSASDEDINTDPRWDGLKQLLDN